MKVYRRSREIADVNAAAAGVVNTPGRWCADRQLQRNVIQPVERGLLTDRVFADDSDVRVAPGHARRRPRRTTRGPPDNVTAGHAQRPDDGDRRAPSQTPSVVKSPPALAAAGDKHRRFASTPRRVTSGRAMAPAVRDGTDPAREKNRSRAVCITFRAEPRRLHAEMCTGLRRRRLQRAVRPPAARCHDTTRHARLGVRAHVGSPARCCASEHG